MAIFYNHIKGCGTNTTGVSETLGNTNINGSETNESWGWITWPSKLKYIKNTSTGNVEDFRDVTNCPDLRFNHINSKPDDNLDNCSLGKFILSDARYQSIKFPFYFADNVQIKKELGVTRTLAIGRTWPDGTNTNNDTNCTVKLSGQATSVIGIAKQHDLAFTRGSVLWFFDSDTTPGPLSTRPNEASGWGDYAAIYKDNESLIFESTNSNSTAHQPGYFAFSSITIENTEGQNNAELLIKGKCEALYFNATSDRRAKTKITPAKFSALQVVNAIPTYTFNYKNSEEKTLGLIAQEAAEFDLDGFNMVDNLEATGQDGDFMQMKESKLVYVLWKAVQELSAEVEELKTQIASLK